MIILFYILIKVIKAWQKFIFKKPENIKGWYSTNIDYSHTDLHSLPIGIADNDRKNLSISEISNYLQTKKTSNALDDTKLLYVNFRENTNLNHRKGLYEYFQQLSWALVDDSNLSNEDYLKIANFPFVFCPWGNGFDSHRIWESLSVGSIPVTKAHITFEQYKDVPIVLVNDYEEISRDYLLNLQSKFLSKKLSNNEIFLDFWIDPKTSRVSNKENKLLNSNLTFINFKEVFYFLNLFIRSKKRLLSTIFWKSKKNYF